MKMYDIINGYFRYANQMTEEKVMEEINNYIPQMTSWLTQYTRFGSSFTKKQRYFSVFIYCNVGFSHTNVYFIWPPSVWRKISATSAFTLIQGTVGSVIFFPW